VTTPAPAGASGTVSEAPARLPHTASTLPLMMLGALGAFMFAGIARLARN
jgi:hypothetical protein